MWQRMWECLVKYNSGFQKLVMYLQRTFSHCYMKEMLWYWIFCAPDGICPFCNLQTCLSSRNRQACSVMKLIMFCYGKKTKKFKNISVSDYQDSERWTFKRHYLCFSFSLPAYLFWWLLNYSFSLSNQY